MSDLSLRNIRKSFGSVNIIHDLDLDVRSGEFVVFVGPSGCGKSTLLRIVAGLETVTSGEVTIDADIVNDLQPSERGIAMVFQSYALYPHMTVYNNMAFGLKIAGTPKPDMDQRVRKAAEMLQLTPYLDRLPRDLSGGQRQRVAIGRAITRNPKLFLFDEPLSNLDAALRAATRVEIAKLKEKLPETTMIYVTHDQIEAMTLADRIVVLNSGRIEQVGTPLELYHNPNSLFVAQFIGSPAMNIVAGVIADADNGRQVKVGNVLINVPCNLDGLPPNSDIKLGVRPEDLRPAADDPSLFSGRVSHIEHLGEVVIAYVEITNSQQVIIKLPGDVVLNNGQTVELAADPARVHIFGPDGRNITRA